MLIHAGFASPVMEMEMLTLTYADLKTLMHDLKGIGATTPRRIAGAAAWQVGVGATAAAYESHRHEGRLPATFEVNLRPRVGGRQEQREDGRKVIQFNIGERRRKAGLA